MLTDDCRLFETEIETSECELVEAARRGELDAFSVLFERNKNAVYSFVHRSVGHREDAEDIVQEVFCRAWNSIGRFRGDSKLISWLFRIAANLCVDRARSAKSKKYNATSVGLEQCAIESIEDQSLSVEDGSLLRQAISIGMESLPISYRMLVVLCDVEGRTRKEAAAIMGCSSTSVSVRLCLAHKKLRVLLSEALDEVS